MPFKVWAVGEEVLSVDFNPYVQEQVVATFANAAARNAAIIAPKVGQVCHVTGFGLYTWDGTAWRSNPPAGTMVPYAGAGAIPIGWLLCNGQAVNRTTYADLFAAISTLWGAGDGSTTFAVPYLLGRVPAGVDAAAAVTPGLATVGAAVGAAARVLTANELPATFAGTTYANGATSNGGRLSGQNTGGTGVGSGAISIPLGNGAPCSFVQPTVAVQYIIKA